MNKFGLRRILHGLRWRFYHLRHFVVGCVLSVVAAFKLRLRLWLRRPQKKHNLPGELIISLTSYPPRFPTLLPTLQCLLTQSVKPDRVILWVTPEDEKVLPAPIRALVGSEFEVRTYHNLGPYKKIIPTLRDFPNAFIVTADDDIYYSSNMVANLLRHWNGDTRRIVCHRGHRIRVNAEGRPLPYNEWEFDVCGPLESVGIFPTGVGGVFYPPGSLSAEVTNEDLFLKLSPRQDDVWLYWMGRRAGTSYTKTAGRVSHILWPGSQKTALMHANLQGNENDLRINAMIGHYGWPGI